MARIVGELAVWPTKQRMAAILRDAGLRLYVGPYSIRVEDCSCFVFQQYGGDLAEPIIDAYSDTVAGMMQGGRLVSEALARAGVKHRFEFYDDDRDEMAGYLHHEWPLGFN
jgi:hypothetical protein